MYGYYPTEEQRRYGIGQSYRKAYADSDELVIFVVIAFHAAARIERSMLVCLLR